MEKLDVSSSESVSNSDIKEKKYFLNFITNVNKKREENPAGIFIISYKQIQTQFHIPNEIAVQLSRIETEEACIKSKDKECDKDSFNQKGWRNYLGLILALLSCFLLSLVLVLVKVLRAQHPFSLSVWRQCGNVIPSLFLVIYFKCWKKQNILEEIWPITKKENWHNLAWLAFRGFLGSSAVIFRFYALDFLTLADLTVLTYSSPIFIIIMAYFILNEKCGITLLIIGFWTLFGVVVTARPPFLTGEDLDLKVLIGTGICLASVFCSSAVTILVRKMRRIHYSVMTLVFGVCGLIQSSIVAVSFGVLTVPQGMTEIGLTTLLALLSFFGQMSMIVSLKFEQAGSVSLIRPCDVIFAFIWQMIFLDVFPDIFSILGASIVLAGVFLTTARKWVSTLPKENSKRKAFGFLLK